MFQTLNCDNVLKNFYQAECDFTFAEIQMLLLAVKGVTLPANPTEQEIQDLITQKQLFPVPIIQLLEDISADAITEEISGRLTRIKEGQTRFQFQVRTNPCNYSALVSFENNVSGAYLIDQKNRIGAILDQTNDLLVPLPVDEFYANKPPIIKNATESPKYSIDIYMDTELIKNQPFGYIAPDPGIMFSLLDGLKDVIFLNAVGSATEITATVALSCGWTPVFGLVDGDFEVLNDAGVAQVISGVVEGADGSYTISGTFTSPAILQLKSPTAQASGLYDTGTAEVITF